MSDLHKKQHIFYHGKCHILFIEEVSICDFVDCRDVTPVLHYETNVVVRKCLYFQQSL